MATDVIPPNWYAGQRDILAHLGTDATLSKVDIMEGWVTDTYEVPMIDGTIKPHVLVRFAGMQGAKEGQHITGAAWDSQVAQFSVSAVAGDPDTAANLSQRVVNSILGYEPVGCGEIGLAFFAGIGAVSANRTPTRYGADQSYRVLVNSTGL